MSVMYQLCENPSDADYLRENQSDSGVAGNQDPLVPTVRENYQP